MVSKWLVDSFVCKTRCRLQSNKKLGCKFTHLAFEIFPYQSNKFSCLSAYHINSQFYHIPFRPVVEWVNPDTRYLDSWQCCSKWNIGESFPNCSDGSTQSQAASLKVGVVTWSLLIFGSPHWLGTKIEVSIGEDTCIFFENLEIDTNTIIVVFMTAWQYFS